MIAFEIYVNGRKLCLAGIGDDGVLSVIANWVTRMGEGDLFLEICGLVSPAREHVAWAHQNPLRVGDRVQVKIVKADSVDKPYRRERIDPAKEAAAKRRYVREMARQLGWKIREPSRRTPS